MTTTQKPFTAEAAIAFINDLEGINGDGCVDIWEILYQRYGEEDSDKAAVVWCLDKYEKVLEPDDAWAKVDEWTTKENIPLKGRYLDLCQIQVQKGIDDQNGTSWLNAHHSAVTRYALVECFDDKIEAILSEFAQYVYEDDMDGLPSITGFQYVEAAKPIIEENAKRKIKARGIKGIFTNAIDGDELYIGDTRELLKAYVERHPEDKVALVEAMIDHEYWELENWLCCEKWYEGLEDAFTVKAKEIYKKACTAWNCEGNDVLKELSITVRQALAKGGVGADEIIEDEKLNEEIAAIKEVSTVPLVGEELLNRINQLEQSGVAPKDVLIRCGYYIEGDDYGKANIDFFDARLKAQKASGSWKAWTPLDPEGEGEEEETLSKEEAIECFRESLDDHQIGDESLKCKARVYLLLDGEISEKVQSIIEEFRDGIDPEDRYEDLISKEEALEIITESVLKYDNERFAIEERYFDFEVLHRYIDGSTVDRQSNDWDKVLMMMEFAKKHPEHPHLRSRFAQYMGSWTEEGMYYNAVYSFKEPVWSYIKDVFDSRDLWGILHCDSGSEVDCSCSQFDEEDAEILEQPQIIEYLKEQGYTIKPRTPESIARAEEQAAKVAAEEKAQRDAYEREYNSVPKEQRDREEAFFTALSDCDFDELITKAEEYKSLLLTNISEFAGNFDSEFPFETTGEEPQWLLQALLKAGAKLSGVSAQSSVAVEGKKVCVTGKLQLKRAEVERQLAIKGAKVVGSVSKNTDLLIVGVDAGSKLDKAKTLGVTVLTEKEAIEQGVISLESMYDYYRYTIRESYTNKERTNIFKDDTEMCEMIGEQEIISRVGVVVDQDNCVVGNFFYTDWADDLHIVRLANGEDFDLYMKTMDGETGHFVYEYFEVIEGGEVKVRVEGISPDCGEYDPDKARRFAECKEMGLLEQTGLVGFVDEGQPEEGAFEAALAKHRQLQAEAEAAIDAHVAKAEAEGKDPYPNKITLDPVNPATYFDAMGALMGEALKDASSEED